jgi:hypothetical protein
MWHGCRGYIKVIWQKHNKGGCVPITIIEHCHNGLGDGDWQQICKGPNQNQNGDWVYKKERQIKLVNFKVAKELGMTMNEELKIQVRELLNLDL